MFIRDDWDYLWGRWDLYKLDGVLLSRSRSDILLARGRRVEVLTLLRRRLTSLAEDGNLTWISEWCNSK